MSKSELSLDEEQELEKNLVWIFGSVRSGTTWLGTELLKHKDNVIWSEPYVGFHLMTLKKHLKRDDYFFSDKFKNSWSPFVKKLILNRAYAVSKSVKNLVIIKDPNGVAGADTIMECLPNSKLIFLLRDGRDVVDSLVDSHKKNSWNEGLAPFSSDQEKLQKIKKYSTGWVKGMDLMLKVYDKHPSNLRILVKYEDLLKNTTEELKNIFSFLKMNISNEDLTKIVDKYDFNNLPENKKGSGKFTRAASPGKWRENLSNEEKEHMEEIMKPILVKCGYGI